MSLCYFICCAGVNKTDDFRFLVFLTILLPSWAFFREFTEEQVQAIFQGFDTGFFYETEVTRLAKGRKHKRIKTTLEYKPMHAEQLRVMLYLCCYTGCRGQDACLMRWSHIDLKRNLIIYTPRKTARQTGKTVSLPLHADLRKALEKAKEWCNTNKANQDYILPAIAARYQYNPSGIQKDVMKVIRCATDLETKTDKTSGNRKLKANLYSLHSFRHTFVSFCANAGVSLDIVAEVVGHGSPAMTKHYAHISNEAKQAIIDALPSQPESKEEKRSVQQEELMKKMAGLDPDKIEEVLKFADKLKRC